MTPLGKALEEYLALRRGLGSELHGPGAYLRRFVDFMNREEAAVITAELALRWATAPAGATPATWALRLGDVRRFAAWVSAMDPRTEVPSRELLRHRRQRRPPYIYTDAEVTQIVRGAAQLSSSLGLRAHTYVTLFALLAVSGLRVGEAVTLDRNDVDLQAGILAIRRTKFGKSRFVPVHDSTRRALRRYAEQRDRLIRQPACPAFFLSERGLRVTDCSARYNFAVVSRAVGLRPPPLRTEKHGRGPRLHDLRHRLAARTLVRWYREGRNVERELHRLSTYLGHVHIASTYWYIEAVPELLQLATERVTGSRGKKP